jgi:hypothetical protein
MMSGHHRVDHAFFKNLRMASPRDASPGVDSVTVLLGGDPTDRDVIVRALVRQPGQLGDRCWQTSCGQNLKAFPSDWASRQLAADVLSERLANLPRNEFLAALEKLRQERDAESDPEIRIAFAWSRKSNVYHQAFCRYVSNINPENLVTGSTPPTGKTLHQGCPK